jgi:exodeoxyribonuclease V gamma subunit
MLTITFSNRFEALRDALLEQLGGDAGAATARAGEAAGAAGVFGSVPVIVPSAALRRDLTLALADRYGICAHVQFGFLAQWLWRQIGQVVDSVGADSPFAPAVLAWRIDAAFADASFTAAHPRLHGYLQHADAPMRHALALRTAGVLEQYLTYRPEWLQAWSQGQQVELGAGGAAAQADQAWQAALWRRLVEALGTGQEHPGLSFLRAVEAQGVGADAANAAAPTASHPGTDPASAAALPATAHVFCLPSIAPLYISLLRQLGRWIDLRLYVLNPCREYWFELVDRRRLAYLARRQAGQAVKTRPTLTPQPSNGLAAGAAMQYHEEGHRLLASWGQQTQACIDLLFDGAEGAESPAVDDDRFETPSGNSLLARLQRDLLDLHAPEPGDYAPRGRDAAMPDAATDRSVEVHVCHSLTRELEVLQDQLLSWFAQPDAPRPSELLVVLPDLAAAAPLIEAVFGTAPRERHIPFAITGRPRSAINPASRALTDLLALAGSRWPVSAVFELLQQPAVGRRFGLTGEALDQVRDWLDDSAVHWGLDAAQVQAMGLPTHGRHSLDDGLQRLFLAYALPDAVAQDFAGQLPAGQVEGADAATLGAFWRFAERLGAWRTLLLQPKTADGWRDTLLGLLDQALDLAPLDIDALHEVQDAVRELHSQMIQGGLASRVPLDVVRTALQALLDDPARGGVPTGAVTFASMSSLRGLPFRGVFVLGLNDGQFPSRTPPAEFDLIALRPRRGDRQRGIDERNVFLDLLLAARERWVLSYSGRSVRDNSVLPPSVLVAELLDFLLPLVAPATALAADRPAALAPARARLVVEHPLQAFSIDAFRTDADPRRRSHRQDYCEALQRGLRATATTTVTTANAAAVADYGDADSPDDADFGGPAPPFFSAPLPSPGPEWHAPTLAELGRFLRNPCRDLLRRRLGIELPKADEGLQDDEAFVPDGRARRRLAERMLPHLLDLGANPTASATGAAATLVRADPGALTRLARAGTELPAGPLGDLWWAEQLDGLQRFADVVNPVLAEPVRPAFSATLMFALPASADSLHAAADWHLSASFTDLRASGLVRWRCGTVRAEDRLEAWLAHLFLCAAGPGGGCEGASDGAYEGASPCAPDSAPDSTPPAPPPRTRWLAPDGAFALAPVDPASARRHLLELLQLFRAGLCAPLHFFPRSAWAFVEADDDLRAARTAWRKTAQRPYAEETDAAYALALRGVADPLDEAFVDTARRVFGTMRPYLEAPT